MTTVPTSLESFTEPQPIEAEDFSFSETLSSLANVNITGHKFLWDSNIKTSYEPEEYTSQEASDVLSGFNLTANKRGQIIEESNNLEEISDKAKDSESLDKDMKRISDMGMLGLAASIGVSIVDIPSLLLGGLIGKTIKAGSVAYNLTRNKHILAQAVGGSATTVGSIGMLEASLDNELTDQALAINAGVGFFLGFAMSRLSSTNPNAFTDVAKTMGTKEIDVKQKVFRVFNFLRNPSDLMKQSNNPLVRRAGYLFNRDTADNLTVNSRDTADDILDVYTGATQKTQKEIFDSVKQQEKKSGNKFNDADYDELNAQGMDVHDGYVKFKEIHTKKEFEATKKEFDIEVKKTLDDIEKGFKHEVTPKTKKPTAKSKKKLKEIKTKKQEEMTLKHETEVKATAKKKALIDRQKLLDAVPERYRGSVDAIFGLGRMFGKEIESTNLNKLQDKIDVDSYWQRVYDIDKIVTNPDGARDAFQRALLANFDDGEITDKITKAMAKQSIKIVNKLIRSKSLFESLDVSQNFITKELGKLTKQTGRLKGRKLRLQGRHLIDFMNNDVSRNVEMYGRNIGGRLTLKKQFNIDNDFTPSDYMLKNKFDSKDMGHFGESVQAVLGTRTIDERSASLGSKIARMLNKVNYINHGGYFGINTLSDMSNTVYAFGFTRSMKYFSDDIVGILKNEGRAGRKLADHLGLACESHNQKYSANYNGDSFGVLGVNKAEKILDTGASYTSKLSGMNMVIDIMDKTVGLSSLDYILTAPINMKFVKTLNTLGLSQAEVKLLRESSDFIKWKGNKITSIDYDKMASHELYPKIERAIRRATADTVLRANPLDVPSFLIEILGSKPLASVLFQFMRFPVVAYNKISRKMYHNWDTVDAIVASATGAFVLGMTTQLKDIGKTEKRYDLTTKDGSLNMASYVVDRMPHASVAGILQSHVDFLGRIQSRMMDEDYHQYDTGLSHLGITPEKVYDTLNSSRRILAGEGTGRDIIKAKAMLSTNMLWVQPFNLMLNEKIHEKF